MSCKHGRLARSCEICELERENAELRSCLKEAIAQFSYLHDGSSENCQPCNVIKRAKELVAKGEK
jgi:hypothetical protein